MINKKISKKNNNKQKKTEKYEDSETEEGKKTNK